MGGRVDAGTTRAASRRPGTAADTGRIVEILSHELRSPITTIHLGAKVLRAGGRGIPGAVRNEVVVALDEEAERLYRLVEDLLAVARHEAGAAPLPLAPLLLQHWLPSAIAAELPTDPGLKVRAGLPSDLPPVLADDGALAHVMRNLLRNAARHAPDGMPVEVVATAGDDGTVHVEVLDRGPGLGTADAERLFEPFFRAPAAEATGSGAGLGLAAARALARAMGGDLAAAPRDGGGARFVLRLATASEDREPA